ncbi:MAG: class I SAM-dependent methyltransferase [Gemmatimonadaceae bacterium]
MDVRTAAGLIKGAVPRDEGGGGGGGGGGGTWADLGAGSGTFTLALTSLLGREARVLALDRDESALAQLRSAAKARGVATRVIPVHADFRERLTLPPLDGVVLANALHFVPMREQSEFLARITAHLQPAGRLLVVDYDGRGANPWVPFPVSRRRLAELFREIGLASPSLVGSQPSRYGGTIYAAWSAVPGPLQKPDGGA